jgi:thiol:disulfide interchange protein DsbD
MSADEIRAAAGSGPDLGLLAALLFAFGGGIVLNLMPCVFPIVSIKILGFVEQAHGDRADLRRHGLAFAAGIIVCFWAVAGLLIALRASGEALGWGYQLQSPPVVAALAVLFFLLGLNLSGYFEVGATVQSAAGSVRDRNGLFGAFLGGLLATAVATPCTAPFMGAALGFALTQPAAEAMLVFTSLAVGMAIPSVLLSFAPGLTRWLPRPGRWMETLKQLLAFPLYLTVVWLVWVLGEQLGPTAGAKLLVGLVLVAAAIWAWRRFSASSPTGGATAGVALLAVALWFAWPTGEPQAAKASTGWASYSEASLTAVRAKGPVFVDFTAAWCVTCQVNKRTVLETEAVRAAFAASGITLVRADWTQRDEEITRALARLGRSGVPVYAMYPAGGAAPELLPELLTRAAVLAAIDRAARR